jgi:Mlc titration factor MtfA (ptsG expression regulator)
MVIVFTLLIVLLLAWLIFRKKTVLSKPIPQSLYKTLLNDHVAYYQRLDEPGKKKFEGLIANFLADTRIEGVGIEINDLDRVLIASAAVIPIFGFPEWSYKNLTNVILYPDTFDKDFQFEGEDRNIMGMVGSGYMNGQMLLSRAALTKGFSASSGTENTAIHEFVHLLDKSDGTTDGIPENLLTHQYSIPWLHMIHQEMHKIQSGHSDINPYGLTNEAEFFAVASEYFFEKPDELKHKHPELFELLTRVFNQKPFGS